MQRCLDRQVKNDSAARKNKQTAEQSSSWSMITFWHQYFCRSLQDSFYHISFRGDTRKENSRLGQLWVEIVRDYWTLLITEEIWYRKYLISYNLFLTLALELWFPLQEPQCNTLTKPFFGESWGCKAAVQRIYTWDKSLCIDGDKLVLLLHLQASYIHLNPMNYLTPNGSSEMTPALGH